VTPQEQELLTSLTQKINQTQLQEKDPDAENLLARELGANPDAVYILAQTVLVQNIALEQAKAQIGQLQQQLQQAQQARQQPAHATSFLGRLLGEKDEPAPPPQGSGVWGGPQQPPPYQPVQQYAPPPQYGPPPQYQPQPQYMPVQSGQPSFLRGAMQTAAGVAAGALAFEGVESILHGFGHGGGYGMGGMGMGPGFGGGGVFERPVEETVINNYYDEPRGGHDGLQGFENERPEGEHHVQEGGAHFNDAGYNTLGDSGSSGDDQMGFDDSSSLGNGGTDDASGFDDGGGDDGAGGFDDGGGFGGDSGGDLI
jgi:hypothetical protein